MIPEEYHAPACGSEWVLGSPPKPDRADGAYTRPPTIALRHDDYALSPGGLAFELFRRTNLTGKIGSGQCPLSQAETDPVIVAAAADIRAMRWHGKLRVEPSGDHAIGLKVPMGTTTATLAVNGEVLLRLGEADRPVSQSRDMRLSKHVRVYLTRGYHRVVIETSSPDGHVAIPGLSLAHGKRRLRSVSDDRLFAELSLARTVFRWDGGPIREYRGPLVAPRGTHVLTYWSEDQAGHVEKPNELKVSVAPDPG